MNDDEARKHIVRTRVSYITVVRAEMRRGLLLLGLKSRLEGPDPASASLPSMPRVQILQLWRYFPFRGKAEHVAS